jgi:hypothetical protein
MRLRSAPRSVLSPRWLLAVVSCAAWAWACSLNPQPLPPDTNDASLDVYAIPDGVGGGTDSASGDGMTPQNGDAAADGAEDASDAALDATDGGDATVDANDDGATDAADEVALDAGDEQ